MKAREKQLITFTGKLAMEYIEQHLQKASVRCPQSFRDTHGINGN
jgi:hypothetical protein